MTRAVALLFAWGTCAAAIERIDADANLTTMKRVFVEPFGGGETAGQLRDMLISALQSGHVVQITENADRADVVLKGSGEDLVYTDEHISSDNLNIHTTGSTSGSSKGYSTSGIVAGENESSHISERKHESSAAVRLVNREGDVIWSATKESQGGKFRGASADVADKIAKQLIHDISAARQAGKPTL